MVHIGNNNNNKNKNNNEICEERERIINKINKQRENFFVPQKIKRRIYRFARKRTLLFFVAD